MLLFFVVDAVVVVDDAVVVGAVVVVVDAVVVVVDAVVDAVVVVIVVVVIVVVIVKYYSFCVGALLNHFIPPIYLESVILGSLFHGDHLSRAVYGRLEIVEDLKTGLPEGNFRL